MKFPFFGRRQAAAPAGQPATQAAMQAAIQAARELVGVADKSSGQGPQAYTGDFGSGGNSPLRRSWAPAARDADADTLRPLGGQRAQCRELARTHPVAIGARGTYLDRVVGTGLTLVPEPDLAVLGWDNGRGREWVRHTQAEFALWADSQACDWRGELNFYGQQRLVAGARLDSGDAFTLLPDGRRSALMPYALRLQVLEADRIGNPGGAPDSAKVAGGVRRVSDGTGGQAEAYHVYKRHPGALGVGADRHAGDWVEAIGPSGRRRILHHWLPCRPEQTRGVPWFAPIVALLKDLDTYSDAEIKAAVVSAFFTVFIKSPGGGAPAPVFGAQGAVGADGTLEMAPAAVLGLGPGEEAQFANPNRPNPQFGTFVEQILALVGMALGIPSEVLLKKFNSSYSASRAAFLDAWMFFRTQRAWLAGSFCQPVYETWLAEAVANGRVVAPGFFADPLLRWAYTRAAWHGDSQGSINPKDEVAAYSAAVDARLMTREKAEWELFGTDWHVTTPRKVAEQQQLEREGIAPVPKAGAAAPAAAPAQQN
jgi:lambda family phage portal protein